jgi:hypothetical protein
MNTRNIYRIEDYLRTYKDICDIRVLLEKDEGWFNGEYRYMMTNDRSKYEDELSQLIISAIDELEKVLSSLSDDFILVLNHGTHVKYGITGQRIEVHRSNCERLKLRMDDKVEHFTNFSEAFEKGYGLTNVINTDIHTCSHCYVIWDKGQLEREVDEWRRTQGQLKNR